MFKRSTLSIFVLLVLLAVQRWTVARRPDSEAVDPRVTEALDLWQGSDTQKRLRALQSLCRLGPQAVAAVPALITGLVDPDVAIRREVPVVLGRIGPLAKEAVPALIAALKDSDKIVRSRAAQNLVATKADPNVAIPALVASIHAELDRRCLTSVEVLGRLGETAVPALIDLLKDRDPNLREMAVQSLRAVGPSAKSAVPALIESFRVSGREARQRIAETLSGIGIDAVQPLCLALRDPDPKVRGGAAYAIEILGPGAVAAIPALIAALSDSNPPDDPRPPRNPGFEEWHREGEAEPSGYYAALNAIGPASVPLLLKRLDSPDRRTRVVAMKALEFLGDRARGAVPRLIEFLSDPTLRFEAATSLGGFWSSARPAIPILIAGLRDPDAGFRACAAESLGRIGWSRQAGQFSSETETRGAIEPLAAATKDPDPRVRAAAARALGDIGDEASIAIPQIVVLLRDPMADARLAALRAILRVGDVPGAAVRTIETLLKDDDSRVRLAADTLIRKKNLVSDVTIEGLLAALKDPDAETRAVAASRLAHVRKHYRVVSTSRPGESGNGEALATSKTAGPALRAALDDTDPRVRATVAYILPILSQEAGDSVPILIGRLKDESMRVRLAAANALEAFGTDASSAIPALFDLVDETLGIQGHDGDSVALASAKAIGAIRRSAASLMNDRLFLLLADPNPVIRRHAADVLVELGSKVTARLTRALADPNTVRIVKVEVIRVLVVKNDVNVFRNDGDLKDTIPEPQQITSVLRVLADDGEDEVRANARCLLALIEPSGDEAARSPLGIARRLTPRHWKVDKAIRALEPSAFDEMIEGLKDPDEEIRTLAANALAALAEKLPWPQDDPDQERPDALKIETRARTQKLRFRAANALTAALKDSDTQVRWAVAWALSAFRTGEKSVAALMEMVADRTTRVRSGAYIRFVRGSGGVTRDFCEHRANGELLRIGAIQALVNFGALAAPAVPALIDAIRDNDALTSGFAATALGEIGPSAKAALPELINLLRSKESVPKASSSSGSVGGPREPERLAVVAAKALGKLGPDGIAAVIPLTEALADPDEVLRIAVVQALGEIGPGAITAIPALVKALDDPEWFVGDTASESLRRLGPLAVPALTKVLQEAKPDVQRRALWSLGGIGPQAAKALPEVILALSDPDEEVREAAAETIGLIGRGPEAEAAVPVLLAALKDSDRLVRTNAAQALGRLGLGVDRSIPVLIETMHESDPEVKGAAMDALARIGLPAFPALWALVREGNEEQREDATFALSHSADPFNSVEEETDEQARTRIKAPRAALIAALKDPDERIRSAVTQALGYIRKDVVPDLIKALADPSPIVRIQATRAFEFMGSDAIPALGALRQRLHDTDPEVRRAAKERINAIFEFDQ